MIEDGFYIPKDPEIFNRWQENANFDKETYLASVRKTVLSEQEYQEYQKVKDSLNEISKFLKVPIHQILNKIQNFKKDINTAKEELDRNEL